MNILITGGSGFIGINLINKLQNGDHKLLNYSRSESADITIPTVLGDIAEESFEFISDFKPDYIIHLAALSSQFKTKELEESLRINTRPLHTLLKKAQEAQVKKVLFMSTSTVYADDNAMPIPETGRIDPNKNFYIRTKVEAENICNEYIKKGLPILIFRLANAYGPHQDPEKSPGLIPQIFSQGIKTQHISVLNRYSVRDWIYIDDVIRAIELGLNSDFVGTLNLGTGEGESVGDMVDLVAQLTNSTVEDQNVPGSGPVKVICDVSKIKEDLGFSAKVPVREGLMKAYTYYKETVK